MSKLKRVTDTIKKALQIAEKITIKLICLALSLAVIGCAYKYIFYKDENEIGRFIPVSVNDNLSIIDTKTGREYYYKKFYDDEYCLFYKDFIVQEYYYTHLFTTKKIIDKHGVKNILSRHSTAVSDSKYKNMYKPEKDE
jgi:hypothetical protein